MRFVMFNSNHLFFFEQEFQEFVYVVIDDGIFVSFFDVFFFFEIIAIYRVEYSWCLFFG